MIKILTQNRLKELLHYNSRTGILTWKVATSRKIHVGGVAGTLTPKGYIRIYLDKKGYMAHRLAWLYVKGKWPKGEIDHKDTIKTHNWIKNLRDVTRLVNSQNLIKANANNKSTGVLNVSQTRYGKYKVHLKVQGKSIHFGCFSTLKIAKGVALRARQKYHD